MTDVDESRCRHRLRAAQHVPGGRRHDRRRGAGGGGRGRRPRPPRRRTGPAPTDACVRLHPRLRHRRCPGRTRVSFALATVPVRSLTAAGPRAPQPSAVRKEAPCPFARPAGSVLHTRSPPPCQAPCSGPDRSTSRPTPNRTAWQLVYGSTGARASRSRSPGTLSSSRTRRGPVRGRDRSSATGSACTVWAATPHPSYLMRLGSGGRDPAHRPGVVTRAGRWP